MTRDNFTELECDCPKCAKPNSLTAIVQSAAHAPKLLDIIVECEECGHRLNAFVDIADMQVLEEGEPSDAS